MATGDAFTRREVLRLRAPAIRPKMRNEWKSRSRRTPLRMTIILVFRRGVALLRPATDLGFRYFRWERETPADSGAVLHMAHDRYAAPDAAVPCALPNRLGGCVLGLAVILRPHVPGRRISLRRGNWRYVQSNERFFDCARRPFVPKSGTNGSKHPAHSAQNDDYFGFS